MRLIERVWFDNHYAKWWMVPLLLPLTFVFWLLSAIRRKYFHLGWKTSVKIDCPVVVVGNIGVGGNGKTPLVVHLVESLTNHGIKVGVISRGYGGTAPHYPYLLSEHSTAKEAGDEPILIYQRCQIPVVVGADRVASANKLVSLGCQIIISDDGLQHYRLGRDYEFIVVDGKRQFGNGLLLPAGPLRESTKRLNKCRRVIINGENQLDCQINTPIHNMTLTGLKLVNLYTHEQRELSDFLSCYDSVNAIAGIGDPQRFFSYLTQLGVTLDKTQEFVDHQTYDTKSFDGVDAANTPLVMTEKDAVKCMNFAQMNWWYLPVDAKFNERDNQLIVADLCKLIAQTQN